MKDGDWRIFVLDKREAMEKECHEIVRVHLMEDSAVSYGFVEQRVQKVKYAFEDQVRFFMYCGFHDLEYVPAPSLRHGMDTIEWLWQENKRKEKK